MGGAAIKDRGEARHSEVRRLVASANHDGCCGRAAQRGYPGTDHLVAGLHFFNFEMAERLAQALPYARIEPIPGGWTFFSDNRKNSQRDLSVRSERELVQRRLFAPRRGPAAGVRQPGSRGSGGSRRRRGRPLRWCSSRRATRRCSACRSLRALALGGRARACATRAFRRLRRSAVTALKSVKADVFWTSAQQVDDFARRGVVGAERPEPSDRRTCRAEDAAWRRATVLPDAVVAEVLPSGTSPPSSSSSAAPTRHREALGEHLGEVVVRGLVHLPHERAHRQRTHRRESRRAARRRARRSSMPTVMPDCRIATRRRCAAKTGGLACSDRRRSPC